MFYDFAASKACSALTFEQIGQHQVEMQRNTFSDETAKMIDAAMALALERRFRYRGKQMSCRELSLDQQGLVGEVFDELAGLIRKGEKLPKAISAACKSLRGRISDDGLVDRVQPIEDIVGLILSDKKVLKKLRKASSRTQHPAANTRKRVPHCHRQPAMAH